MKPGPRRGGPRSDRSKASIDRDVDDNNQHDQVGHQLDEEWLNYGFIGLHSKVLSIITEIFKSDFEPAFR